MKALIIAAGNGTRMQSVTHGRHKSLMNLLGLKIIERVILGAKEAGIFEFVVVIGYKGEELEESIGDGSRFGVSITFVHNSNWEKANGISVFKAKDYFKENFILLMSDHVFDWKTLFQLKRIKLKKDECTLAIDKNLDSVLDIDDTTKVLIKNSRISSLSKDLDAYNAYDTGMFLCSPNIFAVLNETISRHKNSLSDGMRELAKEGKLRAFDIKGKFWSDCDTYADIKFAEKKLLKTLPKSEDYFIARNFNRKVSAFITRFLIKTPITPNMISLGILGLATVTSVLLAQGTYPWLLIGGILIQLISILDGCDGEVARLKFKQSNWGAWFDGTMDKYVDTIIVTGLAYGLWNITGNILIWPITIFVLLGLITDSYMHMKFKRVVGNLIKWKGLGVERDLWMLTLAIGAMTNQVFLILIFLLVFMHYKVFSRLTTAKRISEEIDTSSIQKV
jgi:CDP-L-myo-inositol myo-inositolphosphotransferase